MSNMKKLVASLAAAAMLTASCAAMAENAVGMANPWSDTEFTDLQYSMTLPVDYDEGSMICRTMGEGRMDEMSFSIWDNDISFTMRAEKADGLEDISGIYGEASEQNDFDMDGYEARYMEVKDGDTTHHILLWYAPGEGTAYCLTSDSEGVEQSLMVEIAHQCFLPMVQAAENTEAQASSYDEVVAGYQQLFDKLESSETSDEEKEQLRGENLPLADCPNVLQTVKDLDNDGTAELIISAGCPDDEYYHYMVFAVYTMDENGAPVKVLEGGERNRYYYMGKNLFANIGSNSAFDTVDTTLAYENGQLTDLGYASDPANGENLGGVCIHFTDSANN